MIVIGSVALGYHMTLDNKPNDLDLVGTYDEAVAFRKKFGAVVFYPINEGKSIFMKNAKGEICEIEIAWEGSRAEKLLQFMEWYDNVELFDHEQCWAVPRLDVLYMLKMSHRYLRNSPAFLKTMRDIQKMRAMGCTTRPEHQAFYEERMRDTYTYAHPKLDVSKDGFFDNQMTGVYQKYDHDSIHEAVACLDKPAYKYFQPEDAEVMCSKDMFMAQVGIVQLCAVLEESYVLALERSLVPYPNAMTPKQAFDMALMKVCTSITSGWFREFAWEHYDDVQALYTDGYVLAFEQGVANGVVKLNESA